MYRIFKRICDFIFATIGLILIAPILILISLILLFTGENKVFYFQNRVGFKNEKFSIWKFATMLENSPNLGAGSLTLRDDPRVTKVGKYLRISKLNELPQLINVFLGDMSFVGPRPQTQNDFDVFSDKVKESIYDVRPGVTGIGSIIFRDEEKMISDSLLSPRDFYDKIIAPYKGDVEMWYQRNRSFYVDFKILILTALVIVAPNSASAETWFSDLPKMKKTN